MYFLNALYIQSCVYTLSLDNIYTLSSMVAPKNNYMVYVITAVILFLHNFRQPKYKGILVMISKINNDEWY